MKLEDMLLNIQQRLTANPRLLELAGNRIRAYEYPEQADHDHLFIVIAPLAPPIPAEAGSDKALSLEFTYQINVEGKNREEVREAQHLIANEMSAFNFAQMSGGMDEYFHETERFVGARRYRGQSKLYEVNY